VEEVTKIQELLNELIPLLCEKINIAIRNFSYEGINCKKNQKKLYSLSANTKNSLPQNSEGN